MDQDPLLLVFLDLRKEYDNLDQVRLLKTLEGYGTGPKIRVMLAEFWEWQELINKQNGYHVTQFRVTHGTTQGGLTSLTLFNVELDTVVLHWLSMTVEDDVVIHDGMGHVVGRRMGVFYTDDGLIGSQDPECLQGALNVLISLLRWIGLMANVAKSKTMTCQTGTILLVMPEEDVLQRSTARGATYQDMLRKQLLRPDYGAKLMVGSMTNQCRRLRGTETEID